MHPRKASRPRETCLEWINNAENFPSPLDETMVSFLFFFRSNFGERNGKGMRGVFLFFLFFFFFLSP